MFWARARCAGGVLGTVKVFWRCSGWRWRTGTGTGAGTGVKAHGTGTGMGAQRGTGMEHDTDMDAARPLGYIPSP